MQEPLLAALIEARARVRRDRTYRVPEALVQECMRATDADTLGCAYHTITAAEFSSRLAMPLPAYELQAFVMRYYGYCLQYDPRSAWCDTRYSAAWDLVGWLTNMWNDHSAKTSWLPGWKEWLARIYRHGTPPEKLALVTGTLEHLFENRAIAQFFADWMADPILQEAYRDATMWNQGGGNSPLSREADNNSRR